MLFDENTPYDFKITCPLFADDLHVYHQTLKLLKKERLLPKFEKRLRKVLTDTSDMGWGFHDTLSDYFFEYFDED